VRDKVTAGEKKGLILVGRVVSEEAGMNVCAVAKDNRSRAHDKMDSRR
jgi:hypothetical protein